MPIAPRAGTYANRPATKKVGIARAKKLRLFLMYYFPDFWMPGFRLNSQSLASELSTPRKGAQGDFSVDTWEVTLKLLPCFAE
jgi:hypothetical protein